MAGRSRKRREAERGPESSSPLSIDSPMRESKRRSSRLSSTRGEDTVADQTGSAASLDPLPLSLQHKHEEERPSEAGNESAPHKGLEESEKEQVEEGRRTKRHQPSSPRQSRGQSAEGEGRARRGSAPLPLHSPIRSPSHLQPQSVLDTSPSSSLASADKVPQSTQAAAPLPGPSQSATSPPPLLDSTKTGEEDPVGDQSFHTAEASQEETDTSGSAMADHGHGQQEDQSPAGKAKQPEGPPGRESEKRRYLLHILQQPRTGCAFGSNLLSRLALAPPLIVQMQAIDRAGREVAIEEELPFLFCHVHLLTDDGRPADMLSPTNSPQRASTKRETADQSSPPSLGSRLRERPSTSTARAQPGSAAAAAPAPLPANAQSVRMLYGTLVASPLQLIANGDRPATIFVFPEISVRSRGRFCLRISLRRVPLSSASQHSSTTLATTSTEPFNVVLSADYIAPHITDMTRHFARQGVGLLLPPGQSGD